MKTKGLLIGIGGIGGRKYSAGLKTVGAMAEKLGWEFRYYAWTQGRKAGNEARSASGPVAVIWHSAGKAGSDNFADAFGRKINLAFALDSWFPGQKAHQHFDRVYSITAADFGRFHVHGNNVVAQIVYQDESHTTLDDEPKLHAFVIAKMQALIGASDEPREPDMTMPDLPVELKQMETALASSLNPVNETPEQTRFNKQFFDAIRPQFGSIPPAAIDGMKTIIHAFNTYIRPKGYDDNLLAFVLGNVFNETGKKMIPVRESHASTHEGAMAALDKWWASGKAQKAGVISKYWRDGYYGRGLFQETHLDNYQKGSVLWEKWFAFPLDFVKYPDLFLNPIVSALSAFIGSIEGKYTGKKFSDFCIDGICNFAEARAMINGDRNIRLRDVDNDGVLEAMGNEIGDVCEVFLKALQAAAKPLPVPTRPDPAENAPVPPKNGPVAIPVPDPGGDVAVLTNRQMQILIQQNALLIQELIKLVKPLVTIEHRPDQTKPAILPPETEPKNEDKPMLKDSKFFLKSRGIIGLLLAGIGFLQPAAKPITDILMPGDAAAFDPEVFRQVADTLKQTVETGHMIIGTIGLVISAWGRMDAKTKLTFNLKEILPKTDK